jgi:hypothetical protein
LSACPSFGGVTSSISFQNISLVFAKINEVNTLKMLMIRRTVHGESHASHGWAHDAIDFADASRGRSNAAVGGADASICVAHDAIVFSDKSLDAAKGDEADST